MKKFYIAALFFSIFTLPSYAFYDGNHLLEWAKCYAQRNTRDTGDMMDASMYMGYVAGVTSTLVTARKISLPKRVNTGQLCMIVKKYLEENPRFLHLPGDIIVEKALTSAFGAK